MNPELYALCRAGTDPAITDALELARDPLKKLQRKLAEALDTENLKEQLAGAMMDWNNE